MSIAHLKKGSGFDISKLQNKLGELKGKKADQEETYWKLSVDAADSGSATIRLLPPIQEEEYPFVKIKEYGIGVFHKDLGKKKWYINRSLESINKRDPVKDEFWACYNLGTEQGKEQMKQLRDRESFIVWIYVISDKHAPQNNGKVMKAKLSPSIWKLVEDKIAPEFEEDEPVNVFDPWKGATLNLRAYKGSNGLRSYDKSKWLDPEPLFESDEEFEEMFSQVKGLNSEIDPTSKHYSKSYEELEKQLEAVLGRPLHKNADKKTAAESLEDSFDDDDDEDTPTKSSESGIEYNHGNDATSPSSSQDASDIDEAELRALLEGTDL